MNYRKRGLVYFSGFNFSFNGVYEVKNPEQRDIDIAFVFPVSLDTNKVLLSELSFKVNDKAAAVELAKSGDKIVWTGRLHQGGKKKFEVSFKGRGLDAFTYRLDPQSSTKNFSLTLVIRGGDNFDYPFGVVPAHAKNHEGDTITLNWSYPSLESGVPVGAILPSEKSFDQIIGTMARRGWAPFLLFLAAFIAIGAAKNRKLKFYESYLLAAGYGFFFVLLAYFAAIMDFYVAYISSILIIVGLLSTYGARLWGKGHDRREIAKSALLLVAFLVIPTAAVIAQGYTGLIYSIEILAGLAALMFVSTRDSFTSTYDKLTTQPEEPHHA